VSREDRDIRVEEQERLMESDRDGDVVGISAIWRTGQVQAVIAAAAQRSARAGWITEPY
jgi:hypothetical protein